MLLDLIIEYVKDKGFYQVPGTDDWPLWTRDEWKDWWHNPRTKEVTGDREVPLDQLVMFILAAEAETGDARNA